VCLVQAVYLLAEQCILASAVSGTHCTCVKLLLPALSSCSGILPVLKPIFEQADGEVLLALVKHLTVFYNLMPRWGVWVLTGARPARLCGAQHRGQQRRTAPRMGRGLLLCHTMGSACR
jgi:hypothetical protein